MTAIGVNTKTYPNAIGTDPMTRHHLLTGSNNGDRWLFDTAFPWCWPGGDDPFSRPAAGAPANNSAIRDISEHANGRFVLGSGSAPTYAGGGFDFSGCTALNSNAYVEAPAAVSADLYASQTGSGNQYYLMWGWFKLPAEADWVTESNVVVNLIEIGGYNGTNDLASVAMAAQQISGRRSFRHQMKTATTVTQAQQMPSFGEIALVAFFRDALGAAAMVRTSAAQYFTPRQATSAPGDYSALNPKWGIGSFWTDAATHPSKNNARKFRLYGGGVENLVRSGRAAVDVLNAEWDAQHHEHGAIGAGRWS